ncbi:OmpA family protein [Hydrogenophaga sp.]|jgi:outer membrane protein OmpA-like peptidoglycan-associated protein|uniref:OmpA family protein n=1 Tax=Hydrogenophaga sp. TaxID=1904254 RepID=UPI002727ABD1|nr:OmpA family protein [Hydrogenophaga sp.]MDO9251098.1 OmpA family protein [Hydrogenophaga sp.]MDP2405756.1 OmpA family protein [Hydrogenophaga sp.]MDP3348767.1 OmpA family protein [Hydrogenophaga sp.]MDP3885521.1 OmpA family protein [Hydrogenophaga sp.]MDZ4173008.1 OmpA family protein [Hydrogenophaga sp.]
MFSQDDDQDVRVAAVVLMAAVLLAVGLALGFGIHQSRGTGGATGTEEVAAPAAQAVAIEVVATAAMPAAAAPVVADDASVVIENGVVTFYFASGKAELASGALDALDDAITAAKGGKRLLLSGFHDATGNPVQNAELAKKRALSVRDALVGAGVAAASLELKKPEEAVGTGNDAEARRVEVMIVD